MFILFLTPLKKGADLINAEVILEDVEVIVMLNCIAS